MAYQMYTSRSHRFQSPSPPSTSATGSRKESDFTCAFPSKFGRKTFCSPRLGSALHNTEFLSKSGDPVQHVSEY